VTEEGKIQKLISQPFLPANLGCHQSSKNINASMSLQGNVCEKALKPRMRGRRQKRQGIAYHPVPQLEEFNKECKKK